MMASNLIEQPDQLKDGHLLALLAVFVEPAWLDDNERKRQARLLAELDAPPKDGQWRSRWT
jgi:hypothetical protein